MLLLALVYNVDASVPGGVVSHIKHTWEGEYRDFALFKHERTSLNLV